jgi:hypothetical protein
MGKTAAEKLEEEKQALSKELCELRRKYDPYEPRDAEICERLKAIAAQEEESFKVVVAGEGRVSVSPPKDRSVIGTEPVVVVEKFIGLPKAEQNTLTRRGIVEIAEIVKEAYSGRVTVTLFPKKEGR